jgi:hypothetical protein
MTQILDSTHLGSVGHGLEGRESSGERVRQSPAATTATARNPVRIGVGLTMCGPGSSNVA